MEINKITETGLFSPLDDYEDIWKLNGTHFSIFIVYEKPQWSWETKSAIIDISFEEVLEKVNPELQEKLLFHLDLFR